MRVLKLIALFIFSIIPIGAFGISIEYPNVGSNPAFTTVTSGLFIGGTYTGTTYTGTTGFVTDLISGRTSTGLSFKSYTGTQNMLMKEGLTSFGIQPPSVKFHINNPTTYQFLMTTDTSGHTSTDGFSITQSSTSGEINLRQQENAAMRFYTNNLERLTIFNAGNVGIGVTAPQRKLSVVGDIQCTGNIYESNYSIAEMYVSYNVTAANLVSADTYYTVTANVLSKSLKNFTFTNSGADCYLTCLVAGLYGFNGSASFSGGNSDEFHGGVSINNRTPEGNMEFVRKMGAGGDVGTVSFSGTYQLAVNDTIRVKVKNVTDADDPTIVVLSLVVDRKAP